MNEDEINKSDKPNSQYIVVVSLTMIFFVAFLIFLSLLCYRSYLKKDMSKSEINRRLDNIEQESINTNTLLIQQGETISNILSILKEKKQER